MSEVKLDLINEDLFVDDKLSIDTNIAIIFGKNGTGKSTLTNLFRKQMVGFDLRIFQGFEGIVGESKRLNAVVLGETNNEIESRIEIKQEAIAKKREEVKVIESKIYQNEDDDDNLWARHQIKKKEYDTQSSKLENFFSISASTIKNERNPQISDPNYNKNKFKEEMLLSHRLTVEEINQMRSTLSTTVKYALKVKTLDVDLKEILETANKLLIEKVKQYVAIEEFEGDKEKEKFAGVGFKLHKIGDKCAFCGNEFTSKRETELRSFFSADEIEKFKLDIDAFNAKIDGIQKSLEALCFDKSVFYPEYEKKVSEMNVRFNNQRNMILEFLGTVHKAIEKKYQYLSESLPTLESVLPDDLEENINEYNELVKINNENHLETQQENARDRLRFNKIHEFLDKFKYDVEKNILDTYRSDLAFIDGDLSIEKLKIETLCEEIKTIENEIVELRAETQNEQKLADEINKKLKLYVSFELVYVSGEESEGFYRIKCNRTQKQRDIDKLSTGEKNIIAFLYFIEKLNEITYSVQIPQFIVFDDPMNSNDDTMQYIIIEELEKMFSRCKEHDHKLFVLTHNRHFYLNVKYSLDNYKNNTFIHLESDGKKVNIKRLIRKEDDFKTNYEALWKELKFLKDNSNSTDSMLLNPIRRIIETYSKFNAINKRDMLSKVVGAEKLFNVNSHSIDDLEAELNGKDKNTIIEMLKECFCEIGAEEHFNKYWTI